MKRTPAHFVTDLIHIPDPMQDLAEFRFTGLLPTALPAPPALTDAVCAGKGA